MIERYTYCWKWAQPFQVQRPTPKTRLSIEMRTFDAGPETPQLPVDSTGARHLRDLQSAFLGERDI